MIRPGLVPEAVGAAAYPSTILHDPTLESPRVTSASPSTGLSRFKPYVYGMSPVSLRPIT